MSHAFDLDILGQSVSIRCEDRQVRALLHAGFDAMAKPRAAGTTAAIVYAIVASGDGAGYVVTRRDGPTVTAADAAEAVLLLESDLTLELQRRRSDLCFLHAAAIERDGRAYLLAAESGAGKTTTTWGLLHHGFGFLTDELSAVDLASRVVHPYPYALSFKTPPPAEYPLPPGGVELGHIVHLPTRCLPAPPRRSAVPLGGVLLVRFDRTRGAPSLDRMSSGEASAHLYVTILNALAHRNQGLDAAVALAESLPCYALAAGDLRATCALVERAVADGLFAPLPAR